MNKTLCFSYFKTVHMLKLDISCFANSEDTDQLIRIHTVLDLACKYTLMPRIL